MKRAALLTSAFGLPLALVFVLVLTGPMPCGCDSGAAPSTEAGAADARPGGNKQEGVKS